MLRTRTSRGVRLLAALALLALGGVMAALHARAWDLGGRSPVLSFDAAQYALAARTFAASGTYATPFALPIDLVHHATPPWPLSVVQPGLVVLEAGVERLVPASLPFPGGGDFSTAAHRAWLPLLISLGAWLALALLIATAVRSVLARLGVSGAGAEWVALAAGAVVVLDPEAQHLALGGFTEMPYTLAIVAACGALASGAAARRPFAFGVLLGAAGALRGNLLFVLPIFAVAVALLTPSDRRARAVLAVLAGYVLVLLPWWTYKWHAFGSPFWDLSALAVWDGAAGFDWFALTHRPELPRVPWGASAVGALAEKWLRQGAVLAGGLALGMSSVAMLALAWAWRTARREPDGPVENADARRALRNTAWVIVAHAVVALAVAAAGAGWRRYLFPARVPLEVAGLVAIAWLLARRARVAQEPMYLPRTWGAALAIAVALWGGVQTVRGNEEARAASVERGLPAVATLDDLAQRLATATAPGETVMSNLGSTLAWHLDRPVLHLALGPGDVGACRERLEFRHVLLVFRDAAHTWPAWRATVASPGTVPAPLQGEATAWRTTDGFTAIWITLAP